MANQIIFKNHLKTYLTPMEVSKISLQIRAKIEGFFALFQRLFLRSSKGVETFLICFLLVIFVAILIYGIIQKKNFFFIFSKFIGGTLTILVIIVRVPPMNFQKMKKKNFLDYSIYQNGHKNHLQNTSPKISKLMGTSQKKPLEQGN